MGSACSAAYAATILFVETSPEALLVVIALLIPVLIIVYMTGADPDRLVTFDWGMQQKQQKPPGVDRATFKQLAEHFGLQEVDSGEITLDPIMAGTVDGLAVEFRLDRRSGKQFGELSIEVEMPFPYSAVSLDADAHNQVATGEGAGVLVPEFGFTGTKEVGQIEVSLRGQNVLNELFGQTEQLTLDSPRLRGRLNEGRETDIDAFFARVRRLLKEGMTLRMQGLPEGLDIDVELAHQFDDEQYCGVVGIICGLDGWPETLKIISVASGAADTKPEHFERLFSVLAEGDETEAGRFVTERVRYQLVDLLSRFDDVRITGGELHVEEVVKQSAKSPQGDVDRLDAAVELAGGAAVAINASIRDGR